MASAFLALAGLAVRPSHATVIEQDINMLYAGQPFSGAGEMPPGAGQGKPGVHTSTLEVVAYDSGYTFGDIYVVAYNDANGGTSLTTWDARQNVHRQTYRRTATWKGVNAVGHTRKCINSGITYTNGCGWIAGYKGLGRSATLDLFQVRNLGGLNGVGYALKTFPIEVKTPAGDAGLVCSDPSCTGFTEKLLLVYTNATHSALKCRLVDTSGATIGSEMTLWTGSGSNTIWRPQVAWYQDGLYNGNWVVTFEVKEDCPGVGPWGMIRGMFVTWGGTIGYPPDTELGWCGTRDYCGGTVAAGSTGSEPEVSPMVNGGDCYAMWLAAEAPWNIVYPWLLLTEYNNNYLIGTAGALLQSAAASGSYRPVAGTDVAGPDGPYAFQMLHQVTRSYGRMDNTPPPWNYEDDLGPATGHATLLGQWLRRADSTAGALFTSTADSQDLYLTVLDN